MTELFYYLKTNPNYRALDCKNDSGVISFRSTDRYPNGGEFVITGVMEANGVVHGNKVLKDSDQTLTMTLDASGKGQFITDPPLPQSNQDRIAKREISKPAYACQAAVR